MDTETGMDEVRPGIWECPTHGGMIQADRQPECGDCVEALAEARDPQPARLGGGAH